MQAKMTACSTKYLFLGFLIFVGIVMLISTVTLPGVRSLEKRKVSFLSTVENTSDIVRTFSDSTHHHSAASYQMDQDREPDKVDQVVHVPDRINQVVSKPDGADQVVHDPNKVAHTVHRYHKIYPVNCSAIFSGDETMIKLAGSLITRSSTTKPTSKSTLIPDDEAVADWARICEEYKHGRKYSEKPLSVEEAEFPIAYGMVVYKNAAQVERLLRAIYQPQNVYCIHVDKTSPPQFQKAIQTLSHCFDNVFIASKLVDVKWGDYSAVLADLHCMEDLLNHSVQWKYLLNVCGTDFPLKTNYEIVQQLKAYNNHNCIEGYKRKGTNDEKYRFRNAKGKAPHDIIVYGGDTYIAATREFVNFTIYNKVAKDYLKWLKDVFVPDEYFTAPLNRLPYAPGGHIKPSMDCNVRFRKWTHNKKFGDRPQCIGKTVRQLCIFSTGYLKYFYRTPQLFVNKLDYVYDPITLQCLEELLDYRTYHSDDFHNWQNFPITDYYWQQDSKPTTVIKHR